MATWSGYTDTLVKMGACTSAAIISNTNGGIWGITGEQALITPEEFAKLKEGYGIRSTMSFTIAGTKYMTPVNTEEFVMGKKGKGGLLIVKTPKTFVIAVVTEDANIPIEKLSAEIQKFGEALKAENF